MERAALIDELHRALTALPEVRASYIAGSDAFGRADALSDIDLVVVVAPDARPPVWAALEAAIEALGGARAVYPVPAALTPDFDQRFYQLRRVPETLMLDIALMRPDRLPIWLDPVRHGEPVVLFDPDGLLRPVVDERLGPVFVERLENLRGRARLFSHLPAKALERGRLIEAMDTYQRFLVVPLVEALRAKHSPQRQDFGLRYLHLDLPEPVHAHLLPLFFVADAADLAQKIPLARAWLERELGLAPPGDPTC